MKQKKNTRAQRRGPRRPPRPGRRAPARPAEIEVILEGDNLESLMEEPGLPAVRPGLTGGDLDADWDRASHVGEEAVGGTVATPDQNRVDEIARAVGVERPLDAEVRTSAELLEERDVPRSRLTAEGAPERAPRRKRRRQQSGG